MGNKLSLSLFACLFVVRLLKRRERERDRERQTDRDRERERQRQRQSDKRTILIDVVLFTFQR